MKPRLAGGRSALRRARPLVTAGVAGQLVGLLSIPLLTRLYPEEAFGSLALLSSALAILTPIATLRYEMAVPLAERDDEAVDVGLLALLALCATATVALIVIIGGGALVTARSAAQLVLLGVATAVNVLLSGAYLVGITWLIRKEAFKRIAAVNATQAVAQAVAYLVVGLVLPDRTGMFLGLTIGNLVGLVAVGHAARTAAEPPALRTSRHQVRVAARRYRRFAIVATPGVLLNTVAVELPFLVLARVLSKSAFGVLSVARRITQAPVSLLSQAVGQVFHGSTARTARERSGRVRAQLLMTVTLMSTVAAVALVLYVFVLPPVLTLVFDDRWRETARFARYLAFVFLAQGVASATTAVVDVAERQELQLLRDATRLVSTGVAGIVVLHWSIDATIAIRTFVIIGVANAAVSVLVSMIAARHLDRTRAALQEV